eukprot:1571674-Alexandrium_andersonii.AAC.1
MGGIVDPHTACHSRATATHASEDGWCGVEHARMHAHRAGVSAMHGRMQALTRRYCFHCAAHQVCSMNAWRFTLVCLPVCV